MIIFVPGFAFSLYPAFQVPFAFLMAIFMLNDFIKHRKELKKHDYIIMGLSLVAIFALIVYFIITAWEDINIMMNTVYPGSRFEQGGDYTIGEFIGYLANIFFPYNNPIANPCEPSTYIYPFSALMVIVLASIIGIIKNRKIIKPKLKEKLKNNSLLIAIFVLFIIYLIWLFIGFNKFFATITFLYFSPTKRTQVVVGIIGTILTLMIFKKISDKKEKVLTKLQSFLISLIIVVIVFFLIKVSMYKDFFTVKKLVVALAMLFCMTYFFIRANKKVFCTIMCGIAIIAGLTVNPIGSGTKMLYETDIAKEIQDIVKEDKDALWIGRYNWSAQYLLANGANVLNGVNTYPNFKWLEILDPDGKYNEVYNRYAHIGIILSDKTEFRLLAEDSYEVEVTYDNLRDLGVKYYFTDTESSDEIIDEYNMEMVYSNNVKKQYIYKFN